MIIQESTNLSPEVWDTFIRENYPPVGAFMQTFAWGEFQRELGRSVTRYEVRENEEIIAVFTYVEHVLRFGYAYGYIPRGPVLLASIDPKKISAILSAISVWSKKQFPHLIFLRVEPPVPFSSEYILSHFWFPSNYIQPKYNATINIMKSEEEILGSFHPSTRSNVKRAEKRGVSVTMKESIDTSEYQVFVEMMQDTIKRNSGQNAYPGDAYFRALFKTVPFTVFYGHHEGKIVSAHFVLFFGETATYLYGASHTAHLKSKIDTYLHWTAMKEAKRRGCKWYDLGGIDSKRWPSLTAYKRQYRGHEFEYIGTIEISFRLPHYLIYTVARNAKIWFSKITSRK